MSQPQSRISTNPQRADATEALRGAMAAEGIVTDDRIMPDGRVTTEATGKGPVA